MKDLCAFLKILQKTITDTFFCTITQFFYFECEGQGIKNLPWIKLSRNSSFSFFFLYLPAKREILHKLWVRTWQMFLSVVLGISSSINMFNSFLSIDHVRVFFLLWFFNWNRLTEHVWHVFSCKHLTIKRRVARKRCYSTFVNVRRINSRGKANVSFWPRFKSHPWYTYWLPTKPSFVRINHCLLKPPELCPLWLMLILRHHKKPCFQLFSRHLFK